MIKCFANIAEVSLIFFKQDVFKLTMSQIVNYSFLVFYFILYSFFVVIAWLFLTHQHLWCET